jgi:hypothetical protein
MKPHVPKITPKVARQLTEESRQLREEFAKRLKKMWTISPAERQIVCR